MKKTIRMAVFGDPGCGKSTFAAGAPNPFFITTDANYEYLVDYNGLKEEDHVQVHSWAECKRVFARDFSKYDTIVIDLLEDMYMWAEAEFCKENGITHLSDLGFGKGWKIIGDEFFIEISKVLNLPQNVILIMHGTSNQKKDRRGVEYTEYMPSNLLREKLTTQIEGRVRFFIRAFAETVEDGTGALVTKRYLSLAPDGTTEYGVTRGLFGEVPRYIPLDWNTFYEIATRAPVGTAASTTEFVEATDGPVNVKAAPRTAPTAAPKRPAVKPVIKDTAPVVEATPAAIETAPEPTSTADASAMVEALKAKMAATPVEEEKPVPAKKAAPRKISEVAKPAEPEADVVPEVPASAADKMAAIKAKLAAIKAAKQ